MTTDAHPPRLTCGHEFLEVQALIDGELDALTARALEARLAVCPDCAEAAADLRTLGRTLAAADLRQPAPLGLARRIQSASRASAPARRREAASALPRLRALWPAASGAAFAGLAAAAFLGVQTSADQVLSAELVQSHVRSLQPGHLLDVETSDRHTVKPWFAGRTPFSPRVVDHREQGFALAGGRLDVIGGQAVAAVVYRRGAHVINLYQWPTSPADHALTRRMGAGYALRVWRQGGLTLALVSDAANADLERLQRLLDKDD